jgi:hypothetical protein
MSHLDKITFVQHSPLLSASIQCAKQWMVNNTKWVEGEAAVSALKPVSIPMSWSSKIQARVVPGTGGI